MTLVNLIPRLLNKFASLSFRRFTMRHCKSCGMGVTAGFNWSLVHPECITIGNHFSADINLRLQVWSEYMGESTSFCRDSARNNPQLIIGNNVSMVSNCQISCVNRIEIGDGCLFGDNVFITDNFHGSSNREELGSPPVKRNLFVKGPVIIGKNCWLGRNVCVMSGVTIGDGCTIGANAVVTHDIPANCIAAGVPAKVIKEIK